MAEGDRPDHGRSWMIAVCACLVNMLILGFNATSGIFYLALARNFEIPRTSAHVPFVLWNSMRFIGGPLSGLLSRKFGEKFVFTIGALLAPTGILLCMFAPSITWVTVFWGLFYGIAASFTETPIKVIVAKYFEKHKATALGIATAGSSLGSFVFPSAVFAILEHFDLSSGFLLSAGLIMHVIPISMLITQPSWLEKSFTAAEDKKPKVLPPAEEDIVKDSQNNTVLCVSKNKINSLHFKTVSSTNNKHILKCEEKTNISSPTKSPLSRSIFYAECQLNGVPKDSSNNLGICNPSFVESTTDITKIPCFKEGCSERRRSLSISIADLVIEVPCDNANEGPTRNLRQSICNMYKNPMFHVICITYGVRCLCFQPLFVIIVDYMEEKGFTLSWSKSFISALSAGELVGRTCFGWVTDANYVSRSKFTSLNQTLSGVCFLFIPMMYSLESLLPLVVAIGIGVGATNTLIPVLLGTYLKNEQALAIGFTPLFGGIVSFAVSPLIAHFKGNLGSYNGLLYVCSSLFIACGILWLFEPCLTVRPKTLQPGS